MLVINKPAGIPVHKGKGGGENLEQHFDALRFGLPHPPSLAHRLDKETSGCLVLGRHRKALQKLGRLFELNKVHKIYWAAVHGHLADREGRINLKLGKASERSDNWRMKVDEHGQEAVTHYRVLGQGDDYSWLELQPLTGRTHQLRVHCAAIGHPIIGDYLYGTEEGQRLCLHARSVTLPLYPSRDAITAEAPPPPHMLTYLTRFSD